jgi:hypothetical protein
MGLGRLSRDKVKKFAMAAVCAATLFGPSVASAEQPARSQWAINGYLGGMLANKAEELVQPWKWQFESYNLAGVSLAYDRPINRRWSVGFELQFTGHFGRQEYFEFSLPVTVRYRPDTHWIASIKSLSFGLGGSHASEVPQVEVETRGDSARNMVYWMMEAEFDTKDPDTTWFFRVHHRSDAFGLLEPNTGSNALLLGVRRFF